MNKIEQLRLQLLQTSETLGDLKAKMEKETNEKNAEVLAIDIATHEKLYDELAKSLRIEEESTQKMAEILKTGGKTKTVIGENYLASTKAMDDFAEVLRHNAGKTLADVQDSWKRELVQKGVTNADVLFPKPVVQAITDAFNASGQIFSSFRRIFGVYAWSSAINTSMDSAQGFVPGKNKKEQNITLTPRDITAQEIYKYIRIPRKYLKETESTRSILNYVLSELPMHVVRVIEKTAIIGTPELIGNDAITSITPIATDVAPYMTPNVGSTDNGYIDLMKALSQVKAGGPKYIVTSSEFLTNIRLLVDSTGSFLFPPGTDFKTALGVADIFTPDWMSLEDGAICYAGESYHYVGDGVTDNFRNFILQQNSEEFLSEIMGGGALMLPNSAAKVTMTPITTP